MDRELLRTVLSAELTSALVAVGAVLARVAPAVWIAPFLGGRLVPAPIKIGLMLVLAAALAPQIAPAAASLRAAPPLLVGAVLLKEALVGGALGFVVALVFWGAEAAGRLADTARGASFAEVFVPQLGGRSSALGGLYFQLALVLFLALGGHRIFLTALGASYVALPVTYFPAASGVQGFALLCMRLTADLLLLAVALAAPVLAATLLADAALAIVNRFVPQLNVFFISMPLKALLGIAVLVVSLGALAAALPPALGAALAAVTRAIELLAR